MTFLRGKMTVGLKGQVVIPKDIRDAGNIHPGEEVIFQFEDHKITLEKVQSDKDPVDVFREIAQSINFKGRVNADKNYDEMMEERWRKFKKRT